MNGRTSAVFAAFAMFAVAFAGCLEAPAFLSQTDVEITALEHRDLADNAALAWDPESRLTGVFSIELSEAEEDVPADPTVGNGKTLLWYYAYTSGDGDTSRAFRVTADGTVRAENGTMGMSNIDHDVRPIEDWTVDSDAAVRSAASNQTFLAAMQGEKPVLAEGIADVDGMFAWYLAAMSGSGGAIAMVDASTGTLLWVKPFDFAMEFMPAFTSKPFAYNPEGKPVHVEQAGRLDAETPKLEIPFTVSTLDDDGHLMLAATKDAPTDGLRWVILDDEGEDVGSGYLGWDFTGEESERKFEVELDGPGAYTLVLKYTTLALVPVGGGVDYELMLHVGEMMDHDDEHGHS